MCRRHYDSWLYYGDPLQVGARRVNKIKKCSDCGRDHFRGAKGMCEICYGRARRRLRSRSKLTDSTMNARVAITNNPLG